MDNRWPLKTEVGGDDDVGGGDIDIGGGDDDVAGGDDDLGGGGGDEDDIRQGTRL